MQTLVRLSEEAAAHTSEEVPAWIFGVGTFAVLMLLLVIVSRFDPQR